MRIRCLLLRALPVLLLASCQSIPPAPQASPAAPSGKPNRVLLLSLDGASADDLHRLYEEGVLTAGGFARFFQEGQVADRLIPVDPTLTAVNHISLATGYPAGQTGIVSNTFHPAGAPFIETASGFAATIGTETLWEAAKRQGKRVGVTTWPGADDTGPRRRADWGMTYVNNPDRRAELLSLERGSWHSAARLADSLGIESHSPLQRAQVKIGADRAGTQVFDLLAVDRTDDGAVNYDGILIAQARRQSHPDLGEPLSVGTWEDRPCEAFPAEGDNRETVCRVKLLALDPGLASMRLYFAALFPVQAYPPEFQSALAAQGLTWPGPPDDRSLSDSWAGKPGIDLQTWLEQSDRFTRFFGDSLIAAAKRPDWDLLMGYVPVIDEAGHQLLLTDPRQPGFSTQRRDELAAARRRVWQDVDRELARLLAAIDLKTTTVAIVSDHGMTPVHTVLDANVLLREKGLLASDSQGKIQEQGTAAYAVGSGGVIHVYTAPGRADLVPTLRTFFTDWMVGGEKPVERVLTRQEAADAEIALDHPNSGELIVFLREGFSAHGNLLREGKSSAPTNALGMHGYLNTHPDMHAIYMAVGAGVGQGSAGTVRNPEVAGRVADWLGIEKPRPSP
jgi:predicted AlkP superfamily pyrophosphatase or phosphodiesterase